MTDGNRGTVTRRGVLKGVLGTGLVSGVGQVVADETARRDQRDEEATGGGRPAPGQRGDSASAGGVAGAKAEATEADWPMIRGGSSNRAQVPSGPTEGVQAAWSAPVGGVPMAVESADGSVYLRTRDGTLRALDESLEERWSVATAGGTTVTVADGRVYADVGTEVVAFDAESGDRAGGLEVGSDTWLRLTVRNGRLYGLTDQSIEVLSTDLEQVWSADGWSLAGMAIGGNRVYTGDSEGFRAYDAESGDQVWTQSASDSVRLLAAGPDGTAYALIRGGILRATAADGTELWEAFLSSDYSGSTWGRRMVVDGDTLYVPLRPTHKAAGSQWRGRVQARARSDGSLRWNASVRGSPTTPAIADGRVYVATEDVHETRGGRVVALDAIDGRDRWRTEVGGQGNVQAAVAGDRVFAPASDGRLRALARTDGTVRDALETGGVVVSTPVGTAETVYATTWANDLLALDRADGTPVWQVKLPRYAHTPALADGRLFVVGRRGALQAFDASTGRLRWATPLGDTTAIAPVATSDTVCVTLLREVRAYDASDGTERWSYDTDGGVTRPAVTADAVYAVDDGGIARLDPADGTVEWEAVPKDRDEYVQTAPVVADGGVFTSVDDSIYRIDASDGTVAWSRPTAWIKSSQPVLAVEDGTVYVTSEERVTAIDAADGRRLWRQAGLRDRSTPIAAGDTVYAVDADGGVHALGTDDGAERWRAALGVDEDASIVDGDLFSATATGRLTAFGNRSGPTASVAVRPSTPTVGDQVTFDASGSTAGSGSITEYEWAVDADGIGGASGERTRIRFERTGTVDVTLTVRTTRGDSDETTVSVTVREADTTPTPSPTPTASPSPSPTATASASPTATTSPTHAESLTPTRSPTPTQASATAVTSAGAPTDESQPNGASGPTDEVGTNATAADGPGLGVLAALAGIGASAWGLGGQRNESGEE